MHLDRVSSEVLVSVMFIVVRTNTENSNTCLCTFLENYDFIAIHTQ